MRFTNLMRLYVVLNSDSTKSIELAQDTQKIEREIDIKYRKMVMKSLRNIYYKRTFTTQRYH